MTIRKIQTLTIALALFASLGIAHAEHVDAISSGKILEMTPTKLGDDLNLQGRLTIRRSATDEYLVVRIEQAPSTGLPRGLEGQAMMVTVTTNAGTFDVGATIMRDALGVVRITTETGKSPAFPLSNISSVSVRWNCNDVLYASF